jgi:hypothetical protein
MTKIWKIEAAKDYLKKQGIDDHCFQDNGVFDEMVKQMVGFSQAQVKAGVTSEGDCTHFGTTISHGPDDDECDEVWYLKTQEEFNKNNCLPRVEKVAFLYMNHLFNRLTLSLIKR